MSKIKQTITWIFTIGLVLFFLLLILVPISMIGLAMRDTNDVYREDGDIALVRLEGPIADANDLIKTLRVIGKNKSVKGVLLRVDSPGGGVAASQEIYIEVKKLAKQKRVVVSMGSVAASGGYYVACAAQRIYAIPGTITGSIGVIMENVDVGDLVNFAHVKMRTLKSGEMKDAGSIFRAMTPEEKAYLQAILDQMHAQFIDAVAGGRAMDRAKVVALADGRVYTGEEAKKLGLVDELGTLYDALDGLRQSLGIKGNARVLSADGEGVLSWRSLLKGKSAALLKMVDFSGWGALTPHFVY